MEVKPVIITSHGIQTVYEEFEYLKLNVSQQIADRFREEIMKIIGSLGETYTAYPECRSLRTKGKMYRNVIQAPYLIVYKNLAKEIWVLGVFHSSQNPKKLKRYRRIRK